jgi:hypothetical protein
MSAHRWLAAVSVAAALSACSEQQPVGTTPTESADVALSRDGRHASGFRTEQPAQAATSVPGAKLIPLLTTGDILPESGLPWAPTPDGLGAYREGGDVIVFANHEITASGVTSSNGGPSFLYSRVSRLRVNPWTLMVTGGDYVEDGSGQYIRFCSATWAGEDTGFWTGLFLTGEENGATPNGSTAVAYSGEGVKTVLPWLGAFNHENTVAIPGYHKIVTMGTDDSQGQSELYLYVADNEQAFLQGTGKLYVFKTDAKSAAGNPIHSGNLTVGQSIEGYFAEIADPADLGTAAASRYAALQNKVDALGAMPFVRLEDADYVRGRRHEHGEPTAYFVDTGNESVTGRSQVGAVCDGPCDPYGSIYKIELDEHTPAGKATLTLVARSSGAGSGWSSPDNVGISHKSIMIMEDPANSTFDGSRAPGIWNAPLFPRGRLGAFQEVVELTQETLIPGPAGKCVDAQGLCWESSGIIGTEEELGPGTWLFDVQAHTLPFAVTKDGVTQNYGKESGQLLYLRLPGS